jgi:hypothetical protein
MLRWFLRVTLGLTLLFGLLMAASAVIGRGLNPPVLVAMISQQRASTFRSPTQVALIDLNRFLRADRLIPLDYLQQVSFNYSTQRDVTVTTYQADSRTKYYKAGLYVYDLITDTLTDVVVEESDKPFDISNTGYYYHFFPSPSHRGDRVAFVHPVDQKLYSYDFETQQTSLLNNFTLPVSESEPGVAGGYAINWSPDDTKILIKADETVYILNTEGPGQREYEFDTADFYPTWSENGQYLWTQRFNTTGQMENVPIEMIDLSTGGPLAFTQNIRAINVSWWGCDTRWLTYTVATKNRREGYILDLRDGTTVRVNDAPLLAKESIDFISPLPNCEQFWVTGRPNDPLAGASGQPGVMRPMYLFDFATQSVQYVDEMTGILRLSDEGEIYYEQRDFNPNTFRIIKRVLEPLGTPEVMQEYNRINASWLNWSSDFSYAIFQRQSRTYTGGPPNYLDGASGQVYPLMGEDEYIQTYSWFNWRDVREGK